ncbi:MAG: hypothetical protein WAW02_12365 [Sideroxyarcus sp.]
MIARILLAFPILAASASVQAAWDVGGGLEDYRWVEYPENFNGTPRETGMRSALFVNWTQERDQGLLFAWRAKLYGGTVDYDTFYISTGEPVSTQTEYSGAASEGQILFRNNLGDYKLDYLGGLGLDIWRRSIGNNGSKQIEDYSILFARAGLRLGKTRREAGFHGELGIKYPVSTAEDAHLNDSYSPNGYAYTSNPSLSPKSAVSGYAEFGYRFNARFDVLGYYDSWRFGQSADVIVTDTMGTRWRVFQPKSNMDALGIKLLVSF